MGRIGERPYWVLYLSLVLRAFHQVGAAVFLAAWLFDALPGPPLPYLVMVLASGVALFLTEWMRHRQLYRELSGIVSMAKVLLLGAAVHGFLPGRPTVLLAFVAASVLAHAPKHVRHRLLF
ncbi:hypothetical protein EDC39_103237 [Geothermobacter ehrlichii]|uniref:Uncharacterized protein n=2 Tax=Geothermobacter ehrlichii TaxID=213224 RepID=A0A5D3WLS3_9BACT|nr:hypothetical protein EDC39_103237 [Geothermobacter ehrlichii]